MKAKKIPYSDTVIPYARSKADIEGLLKVYEAKAVRWTEDFADPNSLPILEFIMEVEVRGVKRQLGFRMQPPVLMHHKRINTQYGLRSANIPNKDASLRLMWWYLKSKLEAVSYDLQSFEKEFLSHVITALPSGETTTIGETAEIMISQPSSDYILPSFDIKPPLALPAPETREV